MIGKRLVSPLLTVAFCSSSILGAQSTLIHDPRHDSPSVDGNSKAAALRATIAMNQSRTNALDYLYSHPLFVSPNAIPGFQGRMIQAAPSERAPQVDARPECPMPVARSTVKDDSMPVRRFPAQNVEPMPVAPSLCANPLNASR